MGKIADALEKHKKETKIRAETVSRPVEEPEVEPKEQQSKPLDKIPAPKWHSPKLVVLSAPESMDAENFKVLRGQLLHGHDHEVPRTIMVTSAFPGEGKTFVASNLAASIAQGVDEYVLLVDCDLRRPNIHKVFGYSRGEGLYEYLTEKKALPELLIRTKIKKLSFLPAGKVTRNPSELLSSRRMGEFLKEVRERYDDRFVIIDATPAQVTSEAHVLAKNVDGVLLVVMAQKSPKRAIEKTIENIGKDKILGVVFNGYSKAYRSYDKYYKKYYK